MRQRAVVIGGSIAGLMAAKTLSPFFREVIVLEKDTLDSHCGLHKGVGQGPHSHVILPSGIKLLEPLLGNTELNLRAFGIASSDAAGALRWFQFGVWKKRFHSGVNMGWCNRSRFEWKLRQTILSMASIQLHPESRVTGFIASEDGHRINGIRYRCPGNNGRSRVIKADLVVDASGRGTRTPKWLSEANITEVREDEIRSQVAYTTRHFHLPESLVGSLDWKVLAIYPEPPDVKRGGMIYSLGNDKWIVTLVGFNGEVAPMDITGFIAYARSLPQPDLYNILKQATPIDEPQSYRIPGSLWRRYDKAKRWPGNFLVVGDAVCSFNPIYGQGITMAIKDLIKLKTLLEQQETRFTPETMACLQKQIGRGKRVPWLMAASPDFMFRETKGRQPVGTSLLNRYIKAIMKMAGEDQEVHQRFIEAFTLLKSPAVLVTPMIIWKVVTQILTTRGNREAS